MDRNLNSLQKSVQNLRVALRKESVDRNIIVMAVRLMYNVALRKESVDRNHWIDL